MKKFYNLEASSLFLSKKILKLENDIKNYNKKNNNKHTSNTIVALNKQCVNTNRVTALERTAVEAIYTGRHKLSITSIVSLKTKEAFQS